MKNKCLAHSYLGKSWNRLPNKVKNYICELEQRTDPAGDTQTIASLTQQRDALVKAYKELFTWAKLAEQDIQRLVAALEQSQFSDAIMRQELVRVKMLAHVALYGG